MPSLMPVGKQLRADGTTQVDPERSSRAGKHTLVEQVYRHAVQLRSSEPGARDEAEVHAAAERGVATPATALPHGESIQRLFGRHDISGIRAHTGSEAAASTRAMGAQAFATGNHVVLGGGADLFTVAHEAAHVVQQRGGVQLKGGVGEAGDQHEQHADEVASLVVQGKSAEAALDRYAAAGAPTAGEVQRRAIQLMRIVKQHEDHQEVEFSKKEKLPDDDGHYNDDGYHYEEVSRTAGTILYERRAEVSSKPKLEEVSGDSKGNVVKHDDKREDDHDDERSEGDDEREPNTLDDVPEGPQIDDDAFQHYIDDAEDEIRKLLRKRTNTPDDIYGVVYRATLERILRDTVETWYSSKLSESQRSEAQRAATSCLGVTVPRGAGISPHNHFDLTYALHQAAFETATAAGGVRVPSDDVDNLIDERDYGNPEDTDEEAFDALMDAIDEHGEVKGVPVLAERIELLQSQNSRESMRELQFYTSHFAQMSARFPVAYAIEDVAGKVKGQVSSRRAQAIDYEPDHELTEILDGDLPALPDIGDSIDDVEQDFDVLARKSARPPKGAIFETDMAVMPTQKGIPIDRASVTVTDNMPTPTIAQAPPQEKAMAIGFHGAINFEGSLSAGKPTPSRVYGALFPKGLISKWGVDMRKQDSPNLQKFKNESSGGDQNKLFSIRYEKSTQEHGQVHLHDDWLVEESDGIFHSQIEIVRQRVIGVVEIEQDDGEWVVKSVKDFSGSYGDLF